MKHSNGRNASRRRRPAAPESEGRGRAAPLLLAAVAAWSCTGAAHSGDPGTLPHILYAPADGDDPAFRKSLAALTGGVVDYFDARMEVPSMQLLEQYDAVHVWSNAPFADPAAFGDVLSQFVSQPQKCVVLGYGCVTGSTSLGGGIVTPAFCPVTSSGPLLPGDAYQWDGATCIWTYVAPSFAVTHRETLAVQGTGAIDGTYADGVLAAAFNDPGSGIPSSPAVIYLNGARGSSGTDIPCWVVSAFACHGMKIDPPDDCPEDFNSDRRVDTSDLLFLLGAWGTADGDLDGDGTTAVDDLLILFGAWGKCT